MPIRVRWGSFTRRGREKYEALTALGTMELVAGHYNHHRHHYHHAAISRSAVSNYMSSTLDSSLASNIQKLFSEKVDYFAPVEQSKVDTICNNFERLHIFCQQYIYGISTKVSVLTAIIKLGLKTLLECVRLQTFGRYGLQQMQVQRANVVLIQPLSMASYWAPLRLTATTFNFTSGGLLRTKLWFSSFWRR